MRWANFLHIYQPLNQYKNIVDQVVAESYRPLLEGLQKRKNVRLTLNINSSLIEIFDKFGYHDLIDILREIGSDGRVEFTGSAKYHAILPFLPPDEIARQITINNEANTFFLGKAWKPRGFFPPEMAFDPKIVPIIEELGFSWIILDEIACGGAPGKVDYNSLYKIKDTNLQVFFRERRLSNLIMGANVRSKETLLESMKDDLASDRYVVTAMDGETFGHHRPGLEKLLFEIFDAPEFNLIQISDIEKEIDKTNKTIEIMPVASTWASSASDIEKGVQFLTWSDDTNEIHAKQKELTALTLSEVKKLSPTNPAFKDLRSRMDVGLASDHFFWSSAKPWWSGEMIEGGAHQLLMIVRDIPNVSPEVLERARTLYEEIVSTVFNWQRTGKIREMSSDQYAMQRIPLKDRTFGEGGERVALYNAFIDMMKNLEMKAAGEGEYEKAVLWRDAVYKIEHKNDIYDAVNAIDLLRLSISNEEVEKTLDKYTEEYKRIRGGQPEQRSN